MFTGIIEETGEVKGIKKTVTGISLDVKTRNIYSDVKKGDSIAVNGVCLSVTGIKNNILSFNAMHETLKRTTLDELKLSNPVNLEQSLRADSRIGGHFVSGHVDYKGVIKEISRDADGVAFAISAPLEFSNLLAEKGSVALDGVSLTVAGMEKGIFKVYLIPHTLKVTTLGKKKKGDLVNVELDLLAKYLARQTQKTNLNDLLKKYEYI